MSFTNATEAWQFLKGVVCLYKPSNLTYKQVCGTFLTKLSNDLNNLKCRDLRKYIEITGDTTQQLSVEIKPSYADHPLVVGPRYVASDFKLEFARKVGPKTSGVCRINDGRYVIKEMHALSPVSVYHITGQFGIITDNLFADGKILYKANCDYISQSHIDRVLASIQSVHQKTLFKLMQVKMTSQAAYEIAAAGPVRPIDNYFPVLYSAKCINLNLPYFTIEVNVINETEDYFKSLIAEIGQRLKSCSVAASIQCIRYGYFSLENALLRKHWTLENTLRNMSKCNETIINSKKPCGELEKLENCLSYFEEDTEQDLMEEDSIPCKYRDPEEELTNSTDSSIQEL